MMTFSESIRNGFANFITFSGRASRSEFWWWTLFSTLIGMAAGAVDSLDSLPSSVVSLLYMVGVGVNVGSISLVGPCSIFIAIFLLPPNIAVMVRRFHDVNRSGWWVLFFVVVCLVATGLCIVGAMKLFAQGTMTMLLWGLLLLLLGTAVPSIWVILKGTAGDNRFGLDPLSGEKGT